jgi:hypothetical protein
VKEKIVGLKFNFILNLVGNKTNENLKILIGEIEIEIKKKGPFVCVPNPMWLMNRKQQEMNLTRKGTLFD